MTDITEPLSDGEAHDHIFTATQEVVDAVRTTLGPRGLNKLLVDANGNLVVTNDGVHILQEMAIDHPVGKMLLRLAESQIRKAGDGTTTALILAGELLSGADEILERGVHPTSIVQGYRLAYELIDLELDTLAQSFEFGDPDVYRQIARTSLNGRELGTVDRETAVDLAVNAIDRVMVDQRIDLDAIYFKRQHNRSASESELFPGTVLTHDPSHGHMPTSFDDAAVLLLSSELALDDINESKATHEQVAGETTQKYHVGAENADQLRRFREREDEQLYRQAEAIVDLGVDAVFCPNIVDDRIAEYFSRNGVLAAPASTFDLKYLHTTTGANVVPDVDEATPDDLGRARISRDRRDELFYVEGDDTPRATLLLRGVSKQQVDEFQRSIKTATEAIGRVADDNRTVAGGGAIETELARRLRIHADSVSGREQLAVRAAADSLEAIPRTIAKTAGFDGADALLRLRNRHDAGELDAGIDVDTGEPADMYEAGVIEPLLVKSLAIGSAIDIACMVLRIDGIRPIDGHFDHLADDEVTADIEDE